METLEEKNHIVQMQAGMHGGVAILFLKDGNTYTEANSYHNA